MTSRSPLALAVIVRTLGRARLADALESLARQTSRNFETTVVDMSGGEASPAIAAARPRLPSLTHVAVGRRIGRSLALNLGIRRSRAPAVGVLDDDNLYGPTHVQTLLDGLSSTGADLVYTRVRRQTLTPAGALLEDVERGGAFDRTRLLFGNFIFATGMAFRRDIWRRVGGYDPRFRVYEDWEFLIRVAHAGRVEALDACDAISRNFTGDPGRSAHNLEADDCARAMAGLFWTHRRRYTHALLADRPDLASEYPHVRPGGTSSETRRWLVSWWWHSALRHRRANPLSATG